MTPPANWPPPPPIELTREQALKLCKLQVLWNRDRARRGLDPVNTTETLNRGLDALLAMLEEAIYGET